MASGPKPRRRSATSTSASTRRVTAAPTHLVVTKTAQTSWEKVYTWDVEKSVDKSQLEHEARARRGTVQWKVDVTQTGSTVAERGRDAARSPWRTRTTTTSRASPSPTRFRARSSTATASRGAERHTGLTVPANGSIAVHVHGCRATRSTGGDEQGDRDRLARRRRHLRQRAPPTSRSATRRSRSTRPSRPSTGRTPGTASTRRARSPTPSSSRCSSQGRTNVVDLLGDNPSTPQVETDYKLDTDSASVTVRCSQTPPPPRRRRLRR